MHKNSWVVIFMLLLPLGAKAVDIIYNSRAATALDKVILYPDSNYTKHSNIWFEEGTLFEVLGQSFNEHEDNTQNQKFKWYKVKAENGREGWVFGEGLAVILPDASVDKQLLAYHKKKMHLNNGFENAVIWIAGLEGRDNLHDQDFMNPLYNEYYIVITNERRQSVHINYAGMSAMGRNELGMIKMQDVTGDIFPEIILQRNSFSSATELENRTLEIYSMQAGTLGKIFSERMTLNYEEDIPSPALYKYIEVDDKIIRVEYIDYIFCKDYSLRYNTDATSQTKERCLEFVTYTYSWDDRQKVYKPLYNPSRTAPQAGVKTHSIYLLDQPNLRAKRVAPIRTTDRLEVIKHFEKIVLQNGAKGVENYFYVRMPSGRKGYIPARLIRFVDTAHSKVLGSYYAKSPLAKSDWNIDFPFLRIVPPRNTSVSNR